jgi:sialic acid synthase SpsE
MIINNREYKAFENVYFIAEIGINHNGSMKIAKKIIKMAALYGANAVKFQKRDQYKLWSDEYLNRPYNSEYSFGKTYGEHKAYLEFNEDQYRELKKEADKYEIDFLVSAFDVENLDFVVNKLKIPAIKIASPFVSHEPYLNYASKFDLPIFLSTGMHSIEEIDKAVEILKNKKVNFVLMQCTSIYPLKNENVNLRIIETFRKRYNCEVGYSGHDTGVIAPAIAATFGAVVIEKHVTLDRAMRGPDHGASLESRGLDLTIKYIKNGLKALGSYEKKVLKEEIKTREKYCFSAKAKVEIKKGDIFSKDNIIMKSPRNENSKKFYEILGKYSEKNYKKDEDIL